MPASHRLKVFDGPWRGMEWRESSQTDRHCEIAINIDLSNGYLECRKPTSLKTGATSRNLRLHQTSGTERQIIGIGNNAPTSDTIVFQAWDAGGIALGSEVDMTAAFGEPARGKFRCSFVDATLTSEFEPRFVTLITTDFGVYVYDPKVDDSTVRRADMNKSLVFIDSLSASATPTVTTRAPHGLVTGDSVTIRGCKADPSVNATHTVTVTGARTFTITPAAAVTTAGAEGYVLVGGDTIRIYDSGFAYLTSIPRAPISVEHAGYTFYAGFKPGTQMQLSNPLDNAQNQIPEGNIEANRGALNLGPHELIYSDQNDPLGIPGFHIRATENREPITGLRSFHENLVIFTDRSIYVMTGGSDETFATYRVVSSVGCASHGSITEYQGLLCWMGLDGVYIWPGSGQPRRISEPIEALFTGKNPRSYAPPEFFVSAANTGALWPFTIRHGDMDLINAVHYQEKGQIWFSIPADQLRYRYMELALIWDYVHEGWTFYYEDGGFMFDAVSVRTDGREEIVFSGHAGGLQSTEPASTDGGSGDGARAVYWSSRLFRGNDATDSFRRLRLKLLSTAKAPASEGPKFVISGEESHSDIGDSERQAQSGDIVCHPEPTKGYFWGTAVWGADYFAGRDWFTFDTGASIHSRSFRWGFIDDAGTSERPPYVTVQSVSVEVLQGTVR